MIKTNVTLMKDNEGVGTLHVTGSIDYVDFGDDEKIDKFIDCIVQNINDFFIANRRNDDEAHGDKK